MRTFSAWCCSPWLAALYLWGLLALTPGVLAQERAGRDPQALARAIDAEIQKHLDADKVPVSPRSNDAEYLRRVYLDLAGVIPSVAQATAFLDSKAPDRRAQLVEQLLASPEHARQMTDLWKEMLVPKTAEAMRRDQLPLVRWLNRSFMENRPLDQLVYQLLTASGMQDENPAATFFLVHESIDQLTDRVSSVFLGVPLQCAQCHDHPFTDWKRAEYWALAGFFSKLGKQFERVPGKGDRHGISETAKKTLLLPASAREVPPRFPRGEQPTLDPQKPYLPVLASWVTATDNPYFARAMANRIWAHFFGRGLVNPLDGMGPDNPASHPELLELLRRELIEADFDAHHLMRAICLSETYQRSSRPLAGNRDDQKLYSHMPVRVLLPFQLHDSLEQVWSAGEAIKPQPRPDPRTDPKAEQRLHGSRNGFAAFFAPEEGAPSTEYRAGIPQVLRIMNSKDHHYRGARAASAVLRETKTAEETITRLFLMTLSRRPRADELERLTGLVQKAENTREIYTDLLWALVNSTEMITNH